MPDRDAINQGYEFEKRVANILDGQLQPGSGNKFFAKSDVLAHGALVSCKSEKGVTWARLRNQIKDAIDYASGTGNIPVLAVEDKSDGEEFVIMRLTDLAKAFQEEIKIPEHSDSPGIAKRKFAEVPLMLRD